MSTGASFRVDWLARQMYSRKHPIGRDQIFAAFTEVLAGLTGIDPDAPALTSSHEHPDAQYLGYSAPHLRYRIGAGEAGLVCSIDPILASMGVSGEHHAWSSEGLPAGALVQGRALSSGRQPSYAELTLDRVPEAEAAELRRRFVAAFGRILDADALARELDRR